MVAVGVVIGKIVFYIVLSSHPIHKQFSLSDSVSDPVKAHVYGFERLWRILSLKNPSHVALSVTAWVGGWSCPISMSAMRIAAPL